MNLFEVWEIEPRYPSNPRTVTKKQLKQQGMLTKTEANLIDEEVAKVKIAHGFNEQVINIRPYRDEKYIYEGVMYLTIELKSKTHVKKVAQLIHQMIPTPTILIFSYEEAFCLSSAMKRLNLQTQASILIEKLEVTQWMMFNQLTTVEEEFMKSLAMTHLPYDNFYAFYQAFHATVYNFNHVSQIGEFKQSHSVKSQQAIEERVELIKQKEATLKQVIAKLKKETQFNKKLALNEQAIALQKEIDELKKQ